LQQDIKLQPAQAYPRQKQLVSSQGDCRNLKKYDGNIHNRKRYENWKRRKTM